MLRVTTWQRKARLVIAIAAVAFAVVVVLAFKKREPAASTVPLNPADPKAAVESGQGDAIHLTGNNEDVFVSFKSAKTYLDGSKKMAGVKIRTIREGGREFVMTADHADVTANDKEYSANGNVHLATSAGLEIQTDRADYSEADGSIRAPGAAEFSRGRMRGTGRGFSYVKDLDTLTIINDAVVHVAPDAEGNGGLELSGPTAEFNRPQKIIRFLRGVKIARATDTIEADNAVAHLSDDEQRVQAIDLEGNARTTASKPAVGGLRGLEGRAIALKYGDDGQTLRQAVITGDAMIRVMSDRTQPDRQISGASVDISMAPDGTTPTALTARDNVQLTLPGDRDTPTRTINAKALDGKGEAGRGLTNAHFSGGVQFRERGADIDRTARADTLDAAMAPGLSDIDEAFFSRGVRFVEKGLTADAAAARYALDKGTLELTGTEPATPTPHVVNDRISVFATRIDVTLSGPSMKAVGSVKSEVVPQKKTPGDTAKADDTKMPSLFKQDQVITASAAELTYDGPASKGTYTGGALMWQGDTSIKGTAITFNEKSGDLSATGPVVTTITLAQEEQGKKTKTRSTATSKDFVYEDNLRRATYTGEAHVNGPQGDMTAVKIEMYLAASGDDELERVEGYDEVTLRDQDRQTKGTRMTYISEGERYMVVGAPAIIKDSCGRETTGQKVTWDRATDRLVVDGNERTQTKAAGSTCP